MSNNLTVTANLTVNNMSITGNLVATNGSISLGNVAIATSYISSGNSIANVVINSTNVVVSNATSSTTIGSGYISSANTTLVGATSISSTLETMTIVSSRITLFNTLNFDVLSQSAVYYTNSLGPQGSWTINVRGNSSTTLNSILAVGQSVTVTQLVTQGTGAGYYPTSFTIDGVAQTIKYQFGGSFTFDNSTTSAFTFTIIKTAATPTYTVLASQTRYT